jgi:cytochrome c-type biogenesis protein
MTDELPDERPQRRREYSGAASTLGLAALIVIVVGAGLWFAEFRDSGGSGGGSKSGLGIVSLPDHLNPTGQAPAAQEGRAAPNFRLESPEGKTAQLDAYRGTFVLVNFWASWCPPCRGETPDLQSLYERATADGHNSLIILGVNQQEEASTAKGFAAQFGVTYPILLDITGGVSEAYRVGRGLPVSFLIRPDGVIDKIYLGRLTQGALTEIAAAAKVGSQPQ